MGLETPKERIENRKTSKRNPCNLSAFNEGDNILITVRDDGKGIDPEKIKNSCDRKRINISSRISFMNENDALELIFAPGLSTQKLQPIFQDVE